MSWRTCSWVSWLGVLLAVACGVASVAWAGEIMDSAPSSSGGGSGWVGPVALLTGGGVGGTISLRLLGTVDRMLRLAEDVWAEFRSGRLQWPKLVVEIDADEELRDLLRLAKAKAAEVEATVPAHPS